MNRLFIVPLIFVVACVTKNSVDAVKPSTVMADGEWSQLGDTMRVRLRLESHKHGKGFSSGTYALDLEGPNPIQDKKFQNSSDDPFWFELALDETRVLSIDENDHPYVGGRFRARIAQRMQLEPDEDRATELVREAAAKVGCTLEGGFQKSRSDGVMQIESMAKDADGKSCKFAVGLYTLRVLQL